MNLFNARTATAGGSLNYWFQTPVKVISCRTTPKPDPSLYFSLQDSILARRAI
jgi:hypothetical protein